MSAVERENVKWYGDGQSTGQIMTVSRRCREFLLAKFWCQLRHSKLEAQQRMAEKVKASTSVELYHILEGAADQPRLRHLAFMCLQILVNRPPTMYKEPPPSHGPAGLFGSPEG